MERSASRIDESRHFFLAEDRWNVLGSFRIGSLGRAPTLLESLGIEEPQSREIYRNGARRQLALLEQFRLVFANLRGAQTVGRTLEASREIFHYADVTAYGSFSVITTLEIVQHHFSETGHGNTSCDPHLHQTIEQPTLHYLTRSVRRRAAAFKSDNRKLEIRMEGLVTTVSAEVGCQSEELVVVAVESQSRVGVLAQTYVRRVHQEKSDVEKGHRSYRCRSDKGLEFPARLHQKSNGLNCRPSEHRSVSLSLVADQLFSTLEFRSLRQCEACPAHE